MNRAVKGHNRRLLPARGILADSLLTFEEQPLPRQTTVPLQFLQSLVLVVVIKLYPYLYHTNHTRTTMLCVFWYYE